MGKEGLKLKESVSLKLYNAKGKLVKKVSSKKKVSKTKQLLDLLEKLEERLK